MTDDEELKLRLVTESARFSERVSILEKKMSEGFFDVHRTISLWMGVLGIATTLILATIGLTTLVSVARDAKQQTEDWLEENANRQIEKAIERITKEAAAKVNSSKDQLDQLATQIRTDTENKVDSENARLDALIDDFQKTIDQQVAEANDELENIRKFGNEARSLLDEHFESYSDGRGTSIDETLPPSETEQKPGRSSSDQSLLEQALKWSGQIRTLFRQKLYEEALQTIEEVEAKLSISADPTVRSLLVEAIVRKGLVLRRQGQLREAILVYEHILKEFGNDTHDDTVRRVAWALNNMGHALYELRDVAQSIRIYESYLEKYDDKPTENLDEPTAQVLVNLAVAHSWRRQYGKAIEIYERVIERFENNTKPSVQKSVAFSFGGIGYVEGKRGNIKKAIEAYDRLLSRDPSSDDTEALAEPISNALVNKGLILARNGRGPEAIAVYQRAINTYETSHASPVRENVGWAMNNLAWTLSNLGELEAAVQQFDTLIEWAQEMNDDRLSKVVDRAEWNRRLVLDRIEAANAGN